MFSVYADESCKEKHRYLVIGAIVATTRCLDRQVAAIRHTRRRVGLIKREIKWTKVSRKHLNGYIAICDEFFRLNEAGGFDFHCLIADTHKFDHHKYNRGDPEIGFSKLIYQLLVSKIGRIYAQQGTINVYLDKRNTRYSLDDFRKVLNNGINARFEIIGSPYKRVVFLNSKLCDVLQVNDIILGAIGALANEHHLAANAAQHKAQLAQHIVRRAGIRDVLRGSPYGSDRFTIWNFKLRN